MSLIMCSLDHLRKENAKVRKENAELADTLDAVIADMENLRHALGILQDIVAMNPLMDNEATKHG